MSAPVRAIGPALATLGRAGLALTAAAVVLSSAVWLMALDWRIGPATQRVNVRWVPEATADPAARVRAQESLGLTAARQLDRRTWSYLLANRSHEAIGRILSHPAVEDTHSLDRARRRLRLDQPELPAWLREVLEAEWAFPVAVALVLMATALLWLARGHISVLPRELRSVSSHAYDVANTAGGRVARAVGAVVLDPATVSAGPSAVLPLRWTEVAAGFAIGVVLLAPLLAYGPTDDEELGLGVFSSQIFYRALFHGHWPFWFNNLGFGTPMPIGQRLDFHPVFALASLWSLWAALVSLWIVHVAVMVWYFLRLQAASGTGRPLRIILLACYVFSMPTACYLYQTDWVSVIVAWSLFPAVVFYVHQAVRGAGGTEFWPAAARLALAISLWVLNAHPGYLATLACALAVYVLFVAPLQARVYGCLLSAASLAAVVAAERIWFTVNEVREFPGMLDRITQDGYTLAQHARAAFVPLTDWPSNPRGPFLGIVIGMAALAMLFNAARERNRHVRACSIACFSAAVLSVTPLSLVEPLRVFSGVWFFRDPMVFFALLTGGAALQRALHSFRPSWKRAVWCCVIIQVVQQGVAVGPGFSSVVHQGRSLHFYQDQDNAVGIGAVLARRAASYGSRLYASREVVVRMRGQLTDDGLNSITDLALIGINPINGLFKGVSMDRIYPSRALTRSLIDGQQEVIENDVLLNVLGVNLVMMAAGEGPVPSTLRETDRFRPREVRGFEGPKHDLLVLANETAWPPAVLLDSGAQRLRLPVRPGCPHRGAMCRDYATLAASRLPETLRLSSADGQYVARFRSSRQERLLFLSVLYRPEWQATATGASLLIVPIADAFVGVVVPPDTDEVVLQFEPRVRMALAWLGGGLFWLLAASLGVWATRNRWQHSRRPS